ncbi:MAG: hypothetical protein ACK4ND_09750 [Cytophagaceae bacterium]
MQIYHVIIVYLISLLLATVLAVLIWKGKKRHMFLVFLQAVFEFTGLGLLTFYIANVTVDKMTGPDLGSIILGLAATLVIVMFIMDKVLKYTLPRWLPLVHVGTEVLGIFLLILYI